MSDKERLERLCERMAQAWQTDPEAGDERLVIVMIGSNAEGVQVYGYESELQSRSMAALDVLRALEITCEHTGVGMDVVTIPMDNRD